jgi:hypothetical protein
MVTAKKQCINLEPISSTPTRRQKERKNERKKSIIKCIAKYHNISLK